MPSPRINPPAFLRYWQSWILVMALVLIPFFIKIPLSLQRRIIVGALGDRLHIVFLGIITLLFYWKGPARGRLAWAAIAAALVGALIELVQTQVGRTALWHDFFMDLQGISLVVGFVLWRGHGKTTGLFVIGLTAMIMSWQISYLPKMVAATSECRKSFPQLANFSSPNASALWQGTYKAQVEMSFDNKGIMQIIGGPPSKWPGAQMRHFPHNWTGYKELLVDARIVGSGSETRQLAIRLDDYEGRKSACWVTNHFQVGHKWTTYRMPIVDRNLRHCDRILDLANVDKILLFLPSPQDTVQMQFDNLCLR